MKGRVKYDGSFWIGESYGTWANLFGSFTGWHCVTERCWTQLGATLQLKNWARKQGNEVEI